MASSVPAPVQSPSAVESGMESQTTDRKRTFSERSSTEVAAHRTATASDVPVPTPAPSTNNSDVVDPALKRRRTASEGDIVPYRTTSSADDDIETSSSDEDDAHKLVDIASVAAGHATIKEKPLKPSHVIGHDAFKTVKREDDYHNKPLKVISRMRKNIPARACGRCVLCKEKPCGQCKNCLHNASLPTTQKKQSKRRCLQLRCEKLKGFTGEQIAEKQNDPTVFKPSAEYKFLLSSLSTIDTMRMNALKATQSNYNDLDKYLFYRMFLECTEKYLSNVISRFAQDIAVDESIHSYILRHVPYFMKPGYVIYNHDGRNRPAGDAAAPQAQAPSAPVNAVPNTAAEPPVLL